MSNIDKQALREITAAAVGAHERLSVMPPDDIFDISLAEGTQLDADITALNALNSAANPTTVLAMLDELEAAEKRIAELQIARDKCFLSGLKTGWEYGIADDTEGYNREIDDAQAVIDRAAGIGVKGE